MKKLSIGIMLLFVAITSFSQSFIVESTLPDTILHPMCIKTFGEDIYVLCNSTERWDTAFGIPHNGTFPFGSHIYNLDGYGNEKYHQFYPTAITEDGIDEQSYASAKMASMFYIVSGSITIPFTVYNSFSMCNNNPNVLYQNSKPGFINAAANTGDTLIFKLCTSDSVDCPNSYEEISSALIGNKLMLLYNVHTPNGDSVQIAYRNVDNFELLEKKSTFFKNYFSECFFDETAGIFITQITDNIEHISSIITFDTVFKTTTLFANLDSLNLKDCLLYKTIRTATGEYISVFYYFDYVTSNRSSTLIKYTLAGSILLNVFYKDVMISDMAIDQQGNVYGIQQLYTSLPWDTSGYRLLLFNDTLGITSWKEYDAGSEKSMSIDNEGNFYIAGTKFWNLTVVKDNVSVLSRGSDIPKMGNVFFEISPNPVKDKFTLTLTSPVLSMNVKIYDSKGVLYYSEVFKNCSKVNIDTKELKTGFYFVNVTDYHKNTATRKMIKY